MAFVVYVLYKQGFLKDPCFALVTKKAPPI